MAGNEIIFTIGFDSNGIAIRCQLLPTAHLFVSYIHAVQIRSFYEQLLQENIDTISYCLLIGRAANIPELTVGGVLDSYIYDDPEKGTIQQRAKLFTRVHQLLKKRATQKKGLKAPVLVFIDDIWQLVPRLNKRNSSILKALLLDGAAQHIYLVVGSSLPYRNLLVQLMQPNISKTGPLNEIGAEMIINADNLIFFRERNRLEFENYYPKTK